MDKDFFRIRWESETPDGERIKLTIDLEFLFWMGLGSVLTVLGLFLVGVL